MSRKTSRLRHRGFTLVELMVVVAVLSILAATATVMYTRSINRAKIAELEGYVLNAANGQENYSSRNSSYVDPSCTYDTTKSTDCQKKYKMLLDFNPKIGPSTGSGTEVCVDGGDSSDNDTSCDNSCATGTSCCANADFSGDWYVVVAKEDMDPSTGKKTVVCLHNGMKNPIVSNEGH